MAIISPFNKKEDDKDQQQGQQVVGAPSPISGGQSASISSVAPTSNNQQNSSGRFVNLNKYLNANANYNQAGGGFGGQIGGKIGEKGQEVQNKIQTSAEQFKTQAQQAANPYKNYGQVVQNALADPIATAQGGQNYEQFRAVQNAQYGGPKQIENLTDLQLGVQGVQNYQNLAKDTSGRFQLLKDLYARPTYATGQQKLDQLLLQRTPGNVGAIQTAADQAAQTTQQSLQGAQSETSSLAQQLAQQAEQARAAARSGIEGASSNLQQQLQQKANQEQDRRNATINELRGKLNQGKFTSTQAGMFGVGADEELYGVDASDFLRAGTSASAQNVASAQDYARIQALANLANGQVDDQTKQLFGAFADPRQAGQYYASNDYSYDIPAFQRALAQSRENYLKEANPAQARLSKLEEAVRYNQNQASQGGEGQAYLRSVDQREMDELRAKLSGLRSQYRIGNKAQVG